MFECSISFAYNSEYTATEVSESFDSLIPSVAVHVLIGCRKYLKSHFSGQPLSQEDVSDDAEDISFTVDVTGTNLAKDLQIGFEAKVSRDFLVLSSDARIEKIALACHAIDSMIEKVLLENV